MGDETVAPPLRPSDLGIGRLFELEADAIIVGDSASGRVLLWNPAASRIFGYAMHEALGMSIETLVPEELRERHRQGLARFHRSGDGPIIGRSMTVELPAQHRNGDRLWVELSLTPLHDLAERPGLVLALLRDVTGRKRAEEAAAAATTSLRDFVAMAAHDLRGPLATISQAANMLALTASGDDRELVDVITRQSAFLIDLVADLATASRLDAGVLDVHAEVVVAEDAAELAIESTGLESVDLELMPDLAVLADPSHLHRILTNLLSNAERYGSPPIGLHGVRDGHRVQLCVTDQGPGVPTDFVPRLFDKFTRASARSRVGTGLGLAIARGLAIANNGNLHYEPHRPTGARFVLSLPAA